MSTLLFDLDGTLLDVRARHYAVYSGLLKELGVPPLPEPIYWRRRRAGRSSAALLPNLAASSEDEFRRGWLDRIEQREMLSLDRLHAGVTRTLEALGRVHRLVLITLRHDAGALAWQLETAGLSACFPTVISPPPGVTSKVDLWAGGGDVLVIGDSEADIDLAAAVGGECVCLTHGVRSERFLREHGAGRLVNSLPALLKAI